uniref:RanBD1 domain-containing protein n=1 Tax=Steinernema glaseri TaxID=37863 RepID=A0A1I8A264_9BILA
MTIEQQIEILGSSFDNVLHESFEDRVVYIQVGQKFKPENDVPLTKNRYQASVLLCNGNILTMLRAAITLSHPNNSLPQKFVHFDKLIALSAQLETDPEFDRFQHYARALLYQRIGDYLLLSQKEKENVVENTVHMSLVAYSLALEHLLLLAPSGNDVLSGAAALSILEVHALLAHNIMRVSNGVAAVKDLRNGKDVGSKLLKLFTEEEQTEGNSFLLSDAPFRVNMFNGVPMIDKPKLAKVMWSAVGKHNFLERVAWLFANDSYYAECNYSFIDEWLVGLKVPQTFEDDYVSSRTLTVIDVKMFLFGLSEWMLLSHTNREEQFQLNNLLYSMPAEKPIDVQIRFWNSIVQGESENRRNSVLTSKVQVAKGLESLHLMSPKCTDRRILHAIMTFVSTCIDGNTIPEDLGFQILHPYAEEIIRSVKHDPYCADAKKFMKSVKFDKLDLMTLVEPASTAESDEILKSDASFVLARYYLKYDDFANAEKYAKMVDESRAPNMKRWMEKLYSRWVHAEVDGDLNTMLHDKLKEAEEAVRKDEEQQLRQDQRDPNDTTCNDSFHTVAESLSNTINTMNDNSTHEGTPLATPVINSPAVSRLLSSSQKSFNVRLENESQARANLERKVYEEHQKTKAELEELKRHMNEFFTKFKQGEEKKPEEEDDDKELIEEAVNALCEAYQRLEGPYTEAKAKIAKDKEVVRKAKPLGEIFLAHKEKSALEEKEHMKSVMEFQMQLNQAMNDGFSKLQEAISNMAMRKQAAAMVLRLQDVHVQQSLINTMNIAQVQQQYQQVLLQQSLQCQQVIQQAQHAVLSAKTYERGSLVRSQASIASTQPIVTATIPTASEVKLPEPSAAATSTAPTFSFKTSVTTTAQEKPQKEQEAQNEQSDDEGAEYEPEVHFTPLIPLPDEIEVKTGEEDEEVKFLGRAKLYRWDEGQWKERGIGDLKILRNEKNSSTRIVMRREQVHKICANHKITSTMTLTPMQNAQNAYVWFCKDFSDSEVGSDEKLAARFKEDNAAKFKKAFEEAIEWAKAKDVELPVPAEAGPKKDESDDERAAEYEPDVQFAPVIPLPPKIEVKTGEEGEEVMFMARSKLYRWTDGQWKERGTGDIKILRNEDKGSTRIVMRREQVHNLCANHKITATMTLTPMQNAQNAYVWFCKDFSDSEDGSDEKLAARFKEENAVKFKEAFEQAVEWAKSKEASSAPASQEEDSERKEPEQPGNEQEAQNEQAEDEEATEYEPQVQFTPLIPLPDEIEVTTGEEDEEVKFLGRAKLYRWDEGQWKERGIGELKILRNENTGSTRIVMRRDQIYNLCANHKIYATMSLTPMQKIQNAFSWFCKDFSETESDMGDDEMFAARFKEDVAKEFKAAFEEAVEWMKSKGASCSTTQTDQAVVHTSTSTDGLSAKRAVPQFPVGPMKLEDDDEEAEYDRFENVTVKKFVGKIGEQGALSDNFEVRGTGSLILWHSKSLKRYRATVGESNSVNLLIGANCVHHVSRSQKSVVVDCEDYASGSRKEERMVLCFGTDVEAHRFRDVVGGIVEEMQKGGQAE